MKRNIFSFLLVLIACFFSSCQTVSRSNNASTKNQKQSTSKPAENSSVQNVKKVDADLIDPEDPEAYTPAFFEKTDNEDESTFSDAQNFLNADEASPDDEETETPAIICEDSVYYNAWRTQFDKNWLSKNAKSYKSSAKRAQALQKARSDAYIQFAYPTLEKTSYDFPAVVNLQVAQWIDFFTTKGRKNFVVWLRRGNELIPKLEDILDKNGLPKDLVYLAMIESGFNNRAVSIDGAVGTWQFMPYTGRRYGLIINDWIDERRDPIKATQAAARYLTDLYTRFGSWHLAAGAYNCGEGCISKKLRKYGEDSSYFDLTSQGVINSQTANYVPKILAAMIIAKNPEKFGFETSDTAHNLTKTETIAVNRSISIADLAVNIGVDSKVLGDLNPALRVGITPPSEVLKNNSFNLVIPSSKFNLATDILDTLPEASQNRMVQAKINRRESLQKFSQRYHLSMSSLQKSNPGLRKTSLLKKGQYINVSLTLGTGQYEKLFAVNRHKTKKKIRHVVKKKKLKSPRVVKKKTINHKVVKNKPKNLKKQEAKR